MVGVKTFWLSLLLPCVFVAPSPAQQRGSGLGQEAIRTLKKAATFYHGKVASHGGYVYWDYYTLNDNLTYAIDRSGVVRYVLNAQFPADRHVAEALEVVRKLAQEAETAEKTGQR